MGKKMKSMAVVVLSLALTGAVLTGCGGSRQSDQDMKQDIETGIPEETVPGPDTEKAEETVPGSDTQKAEAGETVQTSERYEDNFAVDSEAAKAFAQKIQEAAARKDLEALAELTAFPVYVGLPGVDVVETKEEFLKLDAKKVFTDELLESVKMADIDHFQPSMAGFPVSDGRTAGINFGAADGVLAVNGINY